MRTCRGFIANILAMAYGLRRFAARPIHTGDGAAYPRPDLVRRHRRLVSPDSLGGGANHELIDRHSP